MNMPSASRADRGAPQNAPAATRVLVWDAPVRVFHWLMVFSFTGAYLSAESERWRLLHVTLGYTMAALVLLRLVWGLIGTRHARFANFVRGPAAVKRTLGTLLQGKPEHVAGHNPAGALAILALLGATLIVTAAGYATYNELGGEWLEDAHAAAANAMLALVGIHLGGVVLSSLLHKENLVGAMISGHKMADPGAAIQRAWRGLALLLLVCVLGFWGWQWQQAPSASNEPTAQAQRHASKDD
jgi:cytochrome b